MSSLPKKYIILDFDECLFEHPSDLDFIFGIAYAEIAIEMGCGLSMEEATRVARQSFLDHGLSHFAFADYGLDIEEMYIRVHPHLVKTYITHHEEEIRSRNLRPHLDHDNIELAILTHGTTHWASEVCKILGISDLFPEERIIGLEKSGFEMKCKSERPFDLALECLGLNKQNDLSNVYFVDDTPRNHVIADRLGLNTVLVGRHGTAIKQERETHSHIHEIHEDLWSFMNTVSSNKQKLFA